MANEWLTAARKIPDEVMSYIRKLAVCAVVEFAWSPECIYAAFGLLRSSLYDWLDKWRRGGYEALETRVAPGAKPLITPDMDNWLKGTILSSDPTDYGYDTLLWTCEILAALVARGLFLERLLAGRKRLLILFVDHAPFHDSKKVRAFHRTNRDKIRMYFLPGYAPEHNPAEQLWGELKDKRIGRQPVKNKVDLKKRLYSTLRSLQHKAESILSFFQLPDIKYAAQQ